MPKRAAPLSAKQVAALKPIAGKQAELVDGQVPGLRVRVGVSGALTWSLNTRGPDGRRRRFDIGIGLSLADARRKANEVRQQIRQGIDPAEQKRALRARTEAARTGLGTLGTIIDAYFDTGPGKLLASRREQRERIKHVFAKHLAQVAADVTPAQLQLTADAHVSGSSASRAVAYVKPVLVWAAKRELVRHGFGELEKPPSSSDNEFGGQRVLTVEELARILPKLPCDIRGQACLFILMTGCRLKEATAATWGEFNLSTGLWTIAAGRRKDTRSRTRKKAVSTFPHVVPLPRQAIALLESLGPQRDGLVFNSNTRGELGNWDRWQKRLIGETGVGNWDRHTLRRTCATLAGELDTPPHVISVLLGHRSIGSSLIAGYNKARYRAEHAHALQRVADLIEAIEKGNSNVVLLRSVS